MELKYTGRAVKLIVGDKQFVSKKEYDKSPKAFAGHFDKMSISQEDATALIESSKLHSFETAKGEDLETTLTDPSEPMPMDVGKKE